jgi:hypothetical protein
MAGTGISTTAPRAYSVDGRDGVRSVRSDVYRLSFSIMLMFMLIIVDVHNRLNTGATDTGSKLRYLLILIPCFSALLIRMRAPSTFIRSPALGDLFLFVLMIYGLGGTLYGSLFYHTHSTAFPIFIPMVIAFLYLWTLEAMTEHEARGLVRLLAWLGLIYASFNAVAQSGRAPEIYASRSYRNAKVLFIAMGIAASVNAKRFIKLGLILALAMYIFLAYPSATSALIALVMLVTLFVTRPKASSSRAYAVAGIAITAAIIALLNFNRTVFLTDVYFAQVGKVNSNIFRLTQYEGAIARFNHSPLFGDAFTKDTTVTVTEPSGFRIREPYHDDYLLLAASGGAFALLLFISWIVATEVTVFRRHSYLVSARQRHRAALVRTALVGYNAWLCAALFNPVLQATATSAILFGLYTLMMAASAAPATSSEPALVLREQPVSTR